MRFDLYLHWQFSAADTSWWLPAPACFGDGSEGGVSAWVLSVALHAQIDATRDAIQEP